jgi:flagellar basal-body rod protein FlgG
LNLKVATDGVVTVKVAGDQEPKNLGQIEVANFVNPTGLNAMSRNLFSETPASGTAIVSIPGLNGTGTIGQGQLEASNVNVVEQMVSMITGQRAYELNSKVIKTGDEMLAATNQLV